MAANVHRRSPRKPRWTLTPTMAANVHRDVTPPRGWALTPTSTPVAHASGLQPSAAARGRPGSPAARRAHAQARSSGQQRFTALVQDLQDVPIARDVPQRFSDPPDGRGPGESYPPCCGPRSAVLRGQVPGPCLVIGGCPAGCEARPRPSVGEEWLASATRRATRRSRPEVHWMRNCPLGTACAPADRRASTRRALDAGWRQRLLQQRASSRSPSGIGSLTENDDLRWPHRDGGIPVNVATDGRSDRNWKPADRLEFHEVGQASARGLGDRLAATLAHATGSPQRRLRPRVAGRSRARWRRTGEVLRERIATAAAGERERSLGDAPARRRGDWGLPAEAPIAPPHGSRGRVRSSLSPVCQRPSLPPSPAKATTSTLARSPRPACRRVSSSCPETLPPSGRHRSGFPDTRAGSSHQADYAAASAPCRPSRCAALSMQGHSGGLWLGLSEGPGARGPPRRGGGCVVWGGRRLRAAWRTGSLTAGASWSRRHACVVLPRRSVAGFRASDCCARGRVSVRASR